MALKVILQRDVPNLGLAGEVKQVAAGYFRNFLLPRGLAVEATKGHMKALETSSSNRASQSVRAREHTDARARELEKISITIPVRLGEQGRIHGSVTNIDIAEALSQQAGVSVDRHKIELREPLRSIGEHSVTVNLDRGIDANLRVELVPESAVAES